MAGNIKAIKGTKDTLPSESYKLQYIEQAALDTAKAYGFHEMRTPVFEYTELFDRAVGETTDKMVKDIQKSIRTDLFTFMGTGTGVAEGLDLQSALAQGWGQLQVKFEDDAIETVYFLNPLDVADYLGAAQVDMQTVFGMNYIENFLGLGSVFINSSVPNGKYYATAKENIILYYVNVATSELARAFDLTTDETGYIGINEYPDKDSARVMDLVMSGITFFPERIDGIVVGTIAGEQQDCQ